MVDTGMILGLMLQPPNLAHHGKRNPGALSELPPWRAT